MSITLRVQFELQGGVEIVQKLEFRFVTGTCNYETGSMTGIFRQLKWELLMEGRNDNTHILFYQRLESKASLPTEGFIYD